MIARMEGDDREVGGTARRQVLDEPGSRAFQPEWHPTVMTEVENSPSDRKELTRSRRARRADDRRQSIISAALRVFSQAEIAAATLEQIAAEADLSKTNVLYYFSSKDEIYRAAIGYALHQWMDALLIFRADDDPIASLRTYIRRKLEFSRDFPEASRLFCAEILRGAPALRSELAVDLKDVVDAKVAVIAEWIAGGKLAPVSPHHLIFSIWAATQHYADFAAQIEALTGKSLSEPSFFEDTVAAVSDLFVDGLNPR